MAKTPDKIDGNELLLNSANKMGRHMDVVRSGCGCHDDKKYSRKEKHRKKYDD